MPVTITNITKGSLADDSKLEINDRIISINGSEINDFLDLQFHSADEILDITYLNTAGVIK
ncbi:MAG: PDZ domain-containing protein, partial [Candidatus Cloacimonetes bacterium]|nr:PDZ domain-containing protein [Candidatus Cloacimonadota bacterium]